MKKILLIIFLAITLEGCLLTRQSPTSGSSARCSPLPNEFTPLSLAGTWMAGWPGHTDTLIIRENGTYKQIVNVDMNNLPSIAYESDWQSWSLEYSVDNIAYLHLSGMSFCGMNPEIPCNVRVSGGFDFCQGESMRMENEGILLVLASREELLPGTEEVEAHIYMHYPLGSENSWVYTFQEP